MNARGFTLVEMIVSTTIVVGIMTSTVLCLTSGTRADRTVTRRSDLLQSARVALDRIAADLRLAVPLHPDSPMVGIDRVIEEVPMEADNLDFATRNYRPVRAGEGDICEASYFVGRDEETGEWCLYRRRDSSPDYKPFEGGVRERIASGVRGLRFEYSDGLLWTDTWGEDPAARNQPTNAMDVAPLAPLPDAIRVSIALAPPHDGRSGRPPKKTEPMVFQRVVKLALASKYRDAEFSGFGSGDGAMSSIDSASGTNGATPGGSGAPSR